jgi:hypothetical protein
MINKILGKEVQMNCECQKVISVVNENVKQFTVITKIGQELFITVLICPYCKKEYHVQVDDMNTKALLSKFTIEIGKLARCKDKKQQPKKKTLGSFDKIRKDLAKSRKLLMEENNGCEVKTILGKKMFKLHFVEL